MDQVRQLTKRRAPLTTQELIEGLNPMLIQEERQWIVDARQPWPEAGTSRPPSSSPSMID
jgi:hypothetical protein